jgi:hypothetical protein
MRTFDSKATRNSDTNKFDYEGFLSPTVLLEFGKYMHTHRKQADGNLRDSDNWQKGIPIPVYMKSLLRHVIGVWTIHRGGVYIDEDTGKPMTLTSALCAVMFNAMGYLFEILKK